MAISLRQVIGGTPPQYPGSYPATQSNRAWEQARAQTRMASGCSHADGARVEVFIRSTGTLEGVLANFAEGLRLSRRSQTGTCACRPTLGGPVADRFTA